MAKTISKKTLRAKGVLALLLVILLGGLTAGYLLTGRSAAAESTPEAVTEAPTEAPTDPPAETTTAAPAETTTEAPTEPASSRGLGLVQRAQDGETLTVTPTGDNWAVTYIGLQYRLPEDYVPELAAAVEGSAEQLDARVAPSYAEMYAAAKADGCTLTPYAGYCSMQRQSENFKNRVQVHLAQGMAEEEAEKAAAERVQPAGASEHNAGLCMDIGSASADFVSTKEFTWLTEHAWEYGFILRYPEDKTDVTGMLYEPWHWRYVGKEAASDMHESGQCLEEYLGLV